MAGPILYSTNPFIAYDICNRFLGELHFAWCSEVFDPTKLNTMTAGSMVAPTSSPYSIANTLSLEVRHEERHSMHFKRYRSKFTRLAKVWAGEGIITGEQAADIKALVNQASYRIWRPLVYIIPRQPLEAAGRLSSVPVKDRASHGPEYKIANLKLNEFDALEWA